MAASMPVALCMRVTKVLTSGLSSGRGVTVSLMPACALSSREIGSTTFKPACLSISAVTASSFGPVACRRST
jgi:hypothetical protein